MIKNAQTQQVCAYSLLLMFSRFAPKRCICLEYSTACVKTQGYMPPTYKGKILIVEDDAAIRELYKLKLQREGYETAAAENGLIGLKLAHDFAPDLILLDLRMPVMSGDEMLARLRQSDWGAAIRIIVLTNISKTEAPHALRLLHVDRYVVKVHQTPSQVVEVVKEVLA